MRNITCLIFTFLIAGLASCTRDVKHDVPKPPVEGSSSIQLNLQLPSQVQTRSTIPGEEYENYIQSVYVLAFRIDDSNSSDIKEYYDYKAAASTVIDGNTSNIKNLTVTVLKKDYKQRFVLIANAYDKAHAIDDSYKDQEKEAVLSKLVFDKSDAWSDRDLSAFTPIPMWGESEIVTINDSPSTIPTINLIRMVARIEVAIGSDEAANVFQLESVHLYNYHTNGCVVPNTSTECWDDTEWKALTVTMPDNNSIKQRGPAAHNAKLSGQGDYVMPFIYTFEATSTELDKSSEATCLVIGGKYKDDKSPTYYRVNIHKKDYSNNPVAHSHLLRNHIYRVKIVSVKGSGHTDPDEAFDSKAENMTVDVLEWNEGDISNIVFDGQYMLGVSPGEFHLPKRGATGNMFEVITDVPGGWQIEFDDQLYPWIKNVNGNWTTPNTKEPVTFDLEDYDGEEDRIGYITIVAGRLRYNVKITQSIYDHYNISITDSDDNEISMILIESYQGSSSAINKYKVTWEPTDATCHVYHTITGYWKYIAGIWDDPTIDTELTGGVKRYDRILPNGFSGTDLDLMKQQGKFLDKSSLMTYHIGEGSSVATKSIEVKQKYFDIWVDIDDSYPYDGQEHSFHINTNTKWVATLTTNPNNIVSEIVTERGNPSPDGGESFKFKMTSNSSAPNSTATVRFTCTTDAGGTFSKDFSIKGTSPTVPDNVQGANSYMLKPSGNAISIPVSWANNSDNPNRIQAGATLTPEILWLDQKTGIGSQSVINSFSIEGTGPTATLNVSPGSQEGNAVIAVKNGNDILWSWHIWVTNYDPEVDGTVTTKDWGDNLICEFMSYNLGATSNSPGNENSIGLLYQWGRKDPFPGIASITNPVERTIYKSDGSNTKSEVTQVAVVNNLDNSIKNPMTFYHGYDESSDWLTTAPSGGFRNDLWIVSNGKGNYDPCPPGWKVPTDQPWSSLIDYSWSGAPGYGGNWTHMGFWPATGFRSGTDGSYSISTTNYAVSGNYWAAFSWSEAVHAQGLTFGTSGADVNTFQRANGYAIRCGRE